MTTKKNGTKKATKAPSVLVGLFLHMRLPRSGSYQQGRIIKTDDRFALVQWFSWLTGYDTTASAISLEELTDAKRFTFYTDEDAWREEGNRIMSRPLDEKRGDDEDYPWAV